MKMKTKKSLDFVASLALLFLNASVATSSVPSETFRQELWGLLGTNPSAHLEKHTREAFAEKLRAYAKAPGADASDVLFAIGSSIFGVDVAPPPSRKSDEAAGEPPSIVAFDYMQDFIRDVFLSYGCTEEQARVSSDVLIEADKRGIDSHGLGRLKPIYCDRMDQGILFADRPPSIVKETDTTALVDGHLGLGLHVGPYCMRLAIEKAKKHGVGFVACQRSTHYGIAGYYATMAAEAGCVGLCGTNARPSIAPTFGVDPMLGKLPPSSPLAPSRRS